MEKTHEIPSSWRWVYVADIVRKVQKVNYKKDSPKKQFKYIDISSIDRDLRKIVDHKKYVGSEAPSRARQLVKEGDILFSTVRTYLMNIAMVTRDYEGEIASTGFSVLRPALVSPKYLFYYFQTREFVEPLNKIQRGTSYPAVRQSDVLEQPVPISPINEQVRIVEKIEELFTRLDQGIKIQEELRIKLDYYKNSILINAFNGTLSKQWREKNNIPIESWYKTSINNISDNIRYGYTAKSTLENVGLKYLRITDIQNDSVDWSSVPYCKIDEDKISKFILEEGDIVFARTGATVGKSYLIKKDVPKSVFASYLIRIKLNRDVLKNYVYYFFKSPFYWNQITEKQVGIGQPNVNATKLSQLEIPIPKYDEQVYIVQVLDKILSNIIEEKSLLKENQNKCVALKQAVLEKAFLGELVSQNPDDEPASVLLEKIKAEKSKNSKRRK